MSTYRELISDVRSMHRITSTDSMITDRAIMAEIIDNSLLLVKRETNLRKLWATDTLFTTIGCLPMEEVPISECCSYPEMLTIARSKLKIPRIAEGNYNYVIQGVYSITVMGGTGKKLKEITINRYLNLLKLPAKKNEEYFWINDDYLYVTNPMVEKVRISALFNGPIPNHIMYQEDDCCSDGDITDEMYCQNPLDKQAFVPGYLVKQVLDMVSKSLNESYFRIQEDDSPEGIDENQLKQRPISPYQRQSTRQRR